MRRTWFGETRPVCDVRHQRYIGADKNVHCLCARMRGMRFAESGPGRISAHVTGMTRRQRQVARTNKTSFSLSVELCVTNDVFTYVRNYDQLTFHF